MAYLLQQLLSASAGRAPDRPAVVSRTGQITYAELETRSNQLARALRAAGVEKGDRVGLYLNKSLEAIVGIFGIMKAGAAYVPIDPDAPPKRAAYIVSNCTMSALVTTHSQWATLHRASPDPIPRLVFADANNSTDAQRSGCSVVCWRELEQFDRDPIAPPYAIEDDLAYILYTSGSTGQPKGVMISHRASLTFVDWGVETFRVGPNDRLSSHAPLHFDLSIFDVFAAVSAGATVVLVPDGLSVFPRQLAQWIDEKEISVWYSVPSILTALVRYGDLTRYSYDHLRTVLFAGEVFPLKYLRQLVSLIPRAAYFNLFGPTETNVCTYYQVPTPLPETLSALPIGKACNNTEAFVFDDQRQVVAPDEVGELWVRGPSVMKGYWGASDRTARALAPVCINPAIGDEILYRTGDLVRRMPEGDYEFLGRRDNQIKSRGYRIELGEIEVALYSHPDVVEAAALAIPDETIGNTIAAVVVARDGIELGVHDLKTFCSQKIPKYMVPGFVEIRASLPKTSTGKTDKTCLQEQIAAAVISGQSADRDRHPELERRTG